MKAVAIIGGEQLRRLRRFAIDAHVRIVQRRCAPRCAACRARSGPTISLTNWPERLKSAHGLSAYGAGQRRLDAEVHQLRAGICSSTRCGG